MKTLHILLVLLAIFVGTRIWDLYLAQLAYDAPRRQSAEQAAHASGERCADMSLPQEDRDRACRAYVNLRKQLN
jgi:hypothetical protein